MPTVTHSKPEFHVSLGPSGQHPTTICVTDLGTNSFHTVALRSQDGALQILGRLKQPVALGSDGLVKGYLTDDAIGRAIEAMTAVREFGRDHDVEGHLAIATSAVREARNTDDFLSAILNATGIDVDVISGELEAYLIYRGVTASLHFPEPCMLVDIGGGSTEITVASSSRIFSSGSYKAGAARLTELYVNSDPITVEDLQNLYGYLETTLREVVEDVAARKIHTMIGSSGTIQALARIATRMPLAVLIDKEFGISAHHVDAVARELIYSARATREEIAELSPRRVNQIVAGAALVAFLIERTGVDWIRISPFALREGVMVEYAAQVARQSGAPLR